MVRKLKPIVHFGDGSRDTRGLPSSMDPRHFYEYRIEQLSKTATGLESLLFRLIPHTYIKSYCIAIDPLYKFKVSPDRVAVTNRTLTKSTLSTSRVLSTRAMAVVVNTYPKKSGFCPTSQILSDTTTTPTNLTSSAKVIDRIAYIQDTTHRTRPIGCDFGEAKIFSLTSGTYDRHAYYDDKSLVENYGVSCPVNRDFLDVHKFGYQTRSPGAYVTPTSALLLRNIEYTRADYFLSKRGLEMVRRAIPTSRHESLLRNIIELRDVPRSVASLQHLLGSYRSIYQSISDRGIRDAVFSLVSKTNRALPTEYLSYQFGWRQLYQDVMSMLFQPAKVGKRINSLIAKAGRTASFGSTIKFIDDQPPTTPPYTIVVTGYDNQPIRNSTRMIREVTLRSSITGNFPFPSVDLPKFRQELFQKMLGENLTPGDLYDLIPWTWLVDWFSGLGNYLHIIQEINDDQTLIDHGFVSYESKVQHIQNYSCGQLRRRYHVYQNVVIENSQTYPVSSQDFVLHTKCYVRKDASTILGIKSPAGTLSLFQQSILGALFAKRI